MTSYVVKPQIPCNCGRPHCPGMFTPKNGRKYATDECSEYAAKHNTPKARREESKAAGPRYCMCGCGKELSGDQTKWYNRDHKSRGVPKTAEQLEKRNRKFSFCTCGRVGCPVKFPAYNNKLYATPLCAAYAKAKQQADFRSAVKAGYKPKRYAPKATKESEIAISPPQARAVESWCYECQSYVRTARHDHFRSLECGQ